jgi:uncharacterized protein YukE
MVEKNDGITVPDDDSYRTWGWKEIEVAILGGVDMSENAQNELTVATTDYQAVSNAATYFSDAQTQLTAVQTGLTNLKKAVNKTWKGKGSEAFNNMLDGFTDALEPVVKALSVGDSGTGYYQTLLSASNSMTTAIDALRLSSSQAAIKTVNRYTNDYNHVKSTYGWLYWKIWYSQHPEPWHVEDGTTIVAVSSYPDIVKTLDKEHQDAIQSLVDDYTKYSGDLVDPGDPKFDLGTNNTDTTPNTYIPPTYKPPTYKPPTFNQSTPNIPTPKLTGGGLDTPKLDGTGLDTPNLGGLNGLTPPGLDALKNADPNKLNGLLGPGGLNGTLDPNKLANSNLKLPPNSNLKLPPTSNLKLPPNADLKLPPTSNLKLPPNADLKLPPTSNLKLPPNPSLNDLARLRGLTLPPLNGLRFPNEAGLRNSLKSPDLLRSGLPGGLRSRLGGLELPGENSILRAGTGTSARALEAAAARRAALQAEQNVLGAEGRAASGLGAGGMPYLPPMGAGAGRGRKDEERERNTWLQEDEDVWGTAPQVGPAFLDGSSTA